MKKLLIITLLLFSFLAQAQDKVGYTRNKTYTTAQRDAINVSDTTIVYRLRNKDNNRWEEYNHTSNLWEAATSSGGGSVALPNREMAYGNATSDGVTSHPNIQAYGSLGWIQLSDGTNNNSNLYANRLETRSVNDTGSLYYNRLRYYDVINGSYEIQKPLTYTNGVTLYYPDLTVNDTIAKKSELYNIPYDIYYDAKMNYGSGWINYHNEGSGLFTFSDYLSIPDGVNPAHPVNKGQLDSSIDANILDEIFSINWDGDSSRGGSRNSIYDAITAQKHFDPDLDQNIIGNWTFNEALLFQYSNSITPTAFDGLHLNGNTKVDLEVGGVSKAFVDDQGLQSTITDSIINLIGGDAYITKRYGDANYGVSSSISEPSFTNDFSAVKLTTANDDYVEWGDIRPQTDADLHIKTYFKTGSTIIGDNLVLLQRYAPVNQSGLLLQFYAGDLQFQFSGSQHFSPLINYTITLRPDTYYYIDLKYTATTATIDYCYINEVDVLGGTPLYIGGYAFSDYDDAMFTGYSNTALRSGPLTGTSETRHGYTLHYMYVETNNTKYEWQIEEQTGTSLSATKGGLTATYAGAVGTTGWEVAGQDVVIGGSESTTVSDTPEVNLTKTGFDITADIILGSIDETKLDASTNASLNLADTSLQAIDLTPLVTTSTIIDLSSTIGNYDYAVTPTTTDIFTLDQVVTGGKADVLVDTTGDIDFPTITGSDRINSSPFEAGVIYNMYVENNGAGTYHSFVKRDISLGESKVISMSLSDPDSDLTTGDKDSFHVPYDFTITNYWIGVNEAPTGSAIIVDVKKNGVSITSSGAEISATEDTSETGTGVSPTITTTTFSKYDKITPNVVQVGSTITGAGLKLYLEVIKL